MGSSFDRRTDTGFYHDGARQLQDRFDTRRLADRLDEVQVRSVFTSEDRTLIERASMFFLATADADGQPDCSYKGGLPGFVRVVDDCTLAFPDYNGNGMYRSLGNALANPRGALLFIDFERPQRLRVIGDASAHDADPLLPAFRGCPARRARAGQAHFPELSALRSRDAAGQTFRLRSAEAPWRR